MSTDRKKPHMLLITLHEWFGPSRAAMARDAPMTTVKEHLTTFATRLPQNEALARIMGYQKAYNLRYHNVTAVNFKLMSICEADDISDEMLIEYQTLLAEELPQTPKEFDR